METFEGEPDYIKTVHTDLTKGENGGESVIVTTHIFGDGNDASDNWTITEIELSSYGRSATLSLGNVLDNDAMAEHIQKLKDIL